jgi:hypothetical protein
VSVATAIQRNKDNIISDREINTCEYKRTFILSYEMKN